MTTPNGNGKGASTWAAASICSTIGLALVGAFGSSYVRDQSRIEAAINDLQNERASLAHARGEIEQRIQQLEARAQQNWESIQEGFRQMDERLQREMRDRDEVMAVELDGLDKRLQTEIGNGFAEHRARLDNIRVWIDAASKDRWTRDDQRRFEDQLGVRLDRKEIP